VGVCSLANGLTPVLPLCPARTGMDRDTLRTPDAATSRFVYGEGWNCFLEPTKAVKARRSKSSTKLFTPAPNTVKRPRLSRGEKSFGGTRLVKATQRPTMDAQNAVEKTRVVLETLHADRSLYRSEYSYGVNRLKCKIPKQNCRTLGSKQLK
jgi:hypothetical protein